MIKLYAAVIGLVAIGFMAGYHTKDLEDHDELLVCRMLVEKLRGFNEAPADM